jgi:hypothetical protein
MPSVTQQLLTRSHLLKVPPPLNTVIVKIIFHSLKPYPNYSNGFPWRGVEFCCYLALSHSVVLKVKSTDHTVNISQELVREVKPHTQV